MEKNEMDLFINRVLKHCEEEGDCWNWHGAVQASSIPAIRWNGAVVSVRRQILLLQGANVGSKLVTTSCRNPLCVCPDHLIAVTRSRLHKRAYQELGETSFGALRNARISAARRVGSVLNTEIVAQIRSDTGSQRARAAKYGVSQSTILDIDKNRIWRDYTNPYTQLMR